LLELCEGSNVSAEIDFDQVPIFKEALPYLEQGCIPGGTHRNWSSYGHKIDTPSDFKQIILCDPQTSGGLLISISDSYIDEFKSLMQREQQDVYRIGRVIEKTEDLVNIL
jgi:selenide,water dikinase